ncbi:hypothetical protein FCL47_02830 [Desulfopila sp. IMCC35006]|nr:hypothetical protein FCL47_02830 [Desulfopila sp. IMCC35006]
MVAAEQNRPQSVAEEIANCISHGIGLVAAFVGTPILIVDAIRNENGRFIIGVSVFCATMIMLYFTSSVYHGLPPGKAKLIAGTLCHYFAILWYAA